MKSLKNSFTVFITVTILGTVYYSCGSSNKGKQEVTEGPLKGLQEANLFVVSRFFIGRQK